MIWWAVLFPVGGPAGSVLSHGTEAIECVVTDQNSLKSTSDPITAKVSRILDKIDNSKDKRWLAKRLEDAHEPSREQRLFEVFKALPLGLNEQKLRAFCQACAKLRNDISHFGGERHDAGHSEFLNDANTKSEALSVLCRALLLHEAGVHGQILKR